CSFALANTCSRDTKTRPPRNHVNRSEKQSTDEKMPRRYQEFRAWRVLRSSWKSVVFLLTPIVFLPLVLTVNTQRGRRGCAGYTW
ncbi:hypothetical protein NP493_2061g00011, partial [Ridgeia piscesae]